jgi:hypothetical protein
MPYYINTSHKYAIGITPNETTLVESRIVDPLVLTVRVISTISNAMFTETSSHRWI